MRGWLRRAPGNPRLAWIHAECWVEEDAVCLRLDFHAGAFGRADIAKLLERWQQAFSGSVGSRGTQAASV